MISVRHSISVFAVLFILLTIPGLVSCGNNGPVAPGPEPLISDNSGPDITDTQPIDENQDSEDSLSDIPIGQIAGGAINDLHGALDVLQNSGGGVLSIPIPADQFAIHIWDAQTKNLLYGDAVVVTGGGPTSLVTVNGIKVFEGATFPLTVTVYVEGYAMETIVGTNANVISLAMTQTHQPKDSAHLFGVSESLGLQAMHFYTDALIPEIYHETYSEFDPNYIEFNMPVEPNRVHGFSAFLDGALGFGELGSGLSYYPLFTMTNHFAWNFEPLSPGDNRFYGITFMEKEGPEATAEGEASMPAPIFDPENINKYGRMMATPTAIFLDTEQYLAFGPGYILEGDDPASLRYSCPWFEPEGAWDRLVLAGHLILPDGSIDILHHTWHTDQPSPALHFSGVPVFGITGGADGTTLPVFASTDPIADTADLVKIEAMDPNQGPLWHITMAGGEAVIDTGDYQVPLTWLQSLYQDFDVEYQITLLDVMSQDIDDYNHDQIIMNRSEIIMSPWTEPGI